MIETNEYRVPPNSIITYFVMEPTARNEAGPILLTVDLCLPFYVERGIFGYLGPRVVSSMGSSPNSPQRSDASSVIHYAS